MIGDELLVEVAVGLASVDERDFVARTSGDGFAMILYGADAAGDAAARLGRYIDIFNRAFHTGDRDGTRTISVAASIGAAHFPADGATADDILRSADVALDAAKARGGAAVVRFDESMTANLRQHLLQTAELADAIGGGQLELVYQPTFALGDTHITGAEALVRWNHPTRGQLPPSEFIAFAERNGLIGRLTRWVIDRAIADVQRMPSLPPGFRCFFNLSSAQLDDVAFMAEFEERLRFVPSIAERLGVEITETAAITNTASSTYALDRFRRLGLRIAIDDFGTGFSSLSYLKRLPVDVIKIDRSFVSGLPSDQKDAALCEMLLQIARRFGLSALAEGIETDAQLRWLRERGCGFGQGYLISKPVAFDAFTALLAPAPEPLVRRLRQPIQLGRSL